MSSQVPIRVVQSREYADTRILVNRNPDPHAAVIGERFGKYLSMSRYLDPIDAYAQRQRLVVAAFEGTRMIGTAAVDTGIATAPEISEASWSEFASHFTEQNLAIYSHLNCSLLETYIGTPQGGLTLHSLAVDSGFRRAGVAKALLRFLLAQLSTEDKRMLYVETARLSWRARLFESVGFRIRRKTISLHERIEFGSWGSVLLQYEADVEG